MAAHRPRATPVLTPYLTVQDTERSTAIYESAFGFSVVFKHEQDGRLVHVQMGMNGEQIVMFAPENACGATCKAPKTLGIESPFTLSVYVPDVDAVYQRALANGYRRGIGRRGIGCILCQA